MSEGCWRALSEARAETESAKGAARDHFAAYEQASKEAAEARAEVDSRRKFDADRDAMEAALRARVSALEGALLGLCDEIEHNGAAYVHSAIRRARALAGSASPAPQGSGSGRTRCVVWTTHPNPHVRCNLPEGHAGPHAFDAWAAPQGSGPRCSRCDHALGSHKPPEVRKDWSCEECECDAFYWPVAAPQGNQR